MEKFTFNTMLAVIFTLGNITVMGQNPQKMDMTQTLSDGAQSTTIAFSGLAFLTGEEESYTFLPPGKLADYFGFQYLRDNDITGMGHNTDFVTKSANNMFHQLNDAQKEQIIALSKTQVELINAYGLKRLPLIHAFRRLLMKEMPNDCTGLDSNAVKEFSAQLFAIDGVISYQRGKLFGNIIRSLTTAQRDSLNELKSQGMLNWPTLDDQIDKKQLTHDQHVAAMTYASEMFAWYCGDVESDVYFCPERQATYFGGFYMKDIPAMGNPNYTIGSNITADKGRAFLETLNNEQAEWITSIIPEQKPILAEIVAMRAAISTELRKFISEGEADSLKIIELSERYGELDGMLAYHYATAFANIGWSLSIQQQTDLMELRDLDEYPATQPFLFSEKIKWPVLENTDNLFKSVITGIIQQETGNRSFVAFPNPFTSNIYFQVSSENEGPVTVEIFDVEGKLVQILHTSDSKLLIWDGLTQSGNTLRKGIYIWRGKTGQQSFTGRISKTE
jgi:hypothetical protein